MRAIIHADGCSLGNPGPAGLGAVVACGGKTREIAEPLGTATNNVAEYSALIRGLECAMDMGATEAEVFMDSELVVRQMHGRYKVRHENLKPLFGRALTLSKTFTRFSVRHIPREKNAHADRLSKLGAEGNTPKRGSHKTTVEKVATPPAHKPRKTAQGRARGSGPGSRGSGESSQGSLF